jgi:hypothetical protein
MTTAPLPLREMAQSLSLTSGGPLFRLERRLGIEASVPRLILATVALTWGVIMLLALADSLVRPGISTAALLKLGGHARLLVGVPLLIVAEWLLGGRVAAATKLLVDHRILNAEGSAEWNRRVKRVERARDAFLPELFLALAVVAITIAGLADVLPGGLLRWLAPTLHAQARGQVPSSPALWWFILVAQPLFLFLLLRWLWHWSLWAFLLVRLARLDPELQSSHPDHVGGIEFLENPLDALVAFVLCVGVVLSATWADEIAATGAAAATFAPVFLVFVAFVLVIAVAPYAALGAPLFRARRAGETAYGGLARMYIGAFDARWVRTPRSSELLGTPDVQSLADMGTAFSVVADMRVSVISVRRATRLTILAVAPIFPPVIMQMPATELARRLIELLL